MAVSEADHCPPPSLPLPPFDGLPCAYPPLPPLHALSPSFVDVMAASVRYLRALELPCIPPLSVPSLSAVLRATPFLSSLSLAYNGWVVAEHLRVLCEATPRLRYLDLAGCEAVRREGLEALTRLPLISLDLSGTGVCDSDLEPLALLPSLLSLSLSCDRALTSYGLSFLGHALPRLLCFDAAWTSLCAGDALPLASFQSLLILNVAYSRLVDDSTLPVIAGLTSLHTLDLFACQRLTDAGLRALGGGTGSEQPQGVEATAFPIRFAQASPRVTASAPPSPPPLSPATSASTSLSAPLLALHLSGAPRHEEPDRGGEGKERAAEGEGRVPVERGDRWDGMESGQEEVRGLQGLSSLSIGALPLVSAPELTAALSRLPSLRSLDLQFSRMDDEGLARIGEAWKAQAREAKPGGLRRLINVSWCQAVSEAGRQALRLLLPDCDVV